MACCETSSNSAICTRVMPCFLRGLAICVPNSTKKASPYFPTGMNKVHEITRCASLTALTALDIFQHLVQASSPLAPLPLVGIEFHNKRQWRLVGL